MNLPHDEITHDVITDDEFTARWIHLTMKLHTIKLPTMNLPHGEITVRGNYHDEFNDLESRNYFFTYLVKTALLAKRAGRTLQDFDNSQIRIGPILCG